MGYDAYVPCNCHRDGLAAAPPFPVIWNENEGIFELAPDTLDLKGRLWLEVHRWQETACVHRSMHAVSLRVGNASAMAELRSAIAAVGSVEVSKLAEALPVSNGGLVEPEHAHDILRDLQRFKRLTEHLPCTGLVDVATGASVFTVFPGETMTFMWTPDGNIGFNADGLFVERKGVELFRAKQVRMHPRPGQRCDFDDVNSSAVLHNAPFPDLGAIEWRVETRQLGWGHFSPILTVLRSLFETSLELGRPVYWS